MIYSWFYRALMRVAHRFDWHYAPMIGPIAPDGSTQRWCQWCGFRESYKVSTCTRKEPHLCGRNGPCNGLPKLEFSLGVFPAFLWRINPARVLDMLAKEIDTVTEGKATGNISVRVSKDLTQETTQNETSERTAGRSSCIEGCQGTAD